MIYSNLSAEFYPFTA